MTGESASARSRCIDCREEIEVPASYAHGDHIKCGACGSKHKVVRRDRLRLVAADPAPLREALAQNQKRAQRLDAELAHARGSFGVGANGVGIGLIYALYQAGLRGAAIDTRLLWGALGVALVSGLLLEAANWAFLAKRHAIARLNRELQEAHRESARLRALIRDAGQV